jgi:hypothetical protein
MLKVIPEEEFEDTKGVIRISKSKVRQHDCQTYKDKGQKERYTNTGTCTLKKKKHMQYIQAKHIKLYIVY